MHRIIIIIERRGLRDGRQSGTRLQALARDCRRDDVHVRLELEILLWRGVAGARRRHVRRGHLEVRHARPETRREGRLGGSLRRRAPATEQRLQGNANRHHRDGARADCDDCHSESAAARLPIGREPGRRPAVCCEAGRDACIGLGPRSGGGRRLGDDRRGLYSKAQRRARRLGRRKAGGESGTNQRELCGGLQHKGGLDAHRGRGDAERRPFGRREAGDVHEAVEQPSATRIVVILDGAARSERHGGLEDGAGDGMQTALR